MIPGRFHIPYSVKNIPLTTRFKYQKYLTNSIENVIERMRWKVYWWKAPRNNSEAINTYGFPSMKKAPACPELKLFEEELIAMISKVETRPVSNPLQDRMREDLEKMEELKDELIVPSDKTSNYYIMKVKDYQKDLDKEIMKEYKKRMKKLQLTSTGKQQDSQQI